MMCSVGASSRIQTRAAQSPSCSFCVLMSFAKGSRPVLTSYGKRALREAKRKREEEFCAWRSCPGQPATCWREKSRRESKAYAETLGLGGSAKASSRRWCTQVFHPITWPFRRNKSALWGLLCQSSASAFSTWGCLSYSASSSETFSTFGERRLPILPTNFLGLLLWSSPSTRSFSSLPSATASCAEVLIVGAGLTGLTAAHALFSRLTPEETLSFRRQLAEDQHKQAQYMSHACSVSSTGGNVVSDFESASPHFSPSGVRDSSCSPETSSPWVRSSPLSSLLPSRSAPSLPPLVLIAESSTRAGGCLHTRKSPCERFLFDVGANSFRLNQGTVDLLRDLNLLSRLQTADSQLERFVGFQGTLLPLPFSSLPALFVSKLLSTQGKLRLLAGICGLFPPRFLWEMTRRRGGALEAHHSRNKGTQLLHGESSTASELVTGKAALTSVHQHQECHAADRRAETVLPGTGREEGVSPDSDVSEPSTRVALERRQAEVRAVPRRARLFSWRRQKDHVATEESVREFVERRLGVEMHDHVVEALVTGICGGDSAKLSMRAALPAAYEALNRGIIVFGLRRGASRVLSYLRACVLGHTDSTGARRKEYENQRTAPRDKQTRGFCTEDRKLEAEQDSKRNVGINAENSGFERGRPLSMRSDPTIAGSQLQGIANLDGGMQTLTDALVARLSPASSYGNSVPCSGVSCSSSSLPPVEGECALRLGWELKDLRIVSQPCPPASLEFSTAIPLSSACPSPADAVLPCHADFLSRPPPSTPFKFEAMFDTPEGMQRLYAKHVLVTVPPKAAGSALKHLLSADLTKRIRDLPCVSMALVTLAYSKAAFQEFRSRKQRRLAEENERQAAPADGRSDERPAARQVDITNEATQGEADAKEAVEPRMPGSCTPSGAARRTHQEPLYSFVGAPDSKTRNERQLLNPEEEEEETGSVVRGFGFLLPTKERERENWRTLGGIFVSDVFEGRVPVLLEKSFFRDGHCKTAPLGRQRDQPEKHLLENQDRLLTGRSGSELGEGKQFAFSGVTKPEEKSAGVAGKKDVASGRMGVNDDRASTPACWVTERGEAGDTGLATIFIGGVRDGAKLLKEPDAELGLLAKADLVRAFLGKGESREDEAERNVLMREAIKVLNVERWKDTIPQYCKGHEALVRELDEEAKLISARRTGFENADGAAVMQDFIGKRGDGRPFGKKDEMSRPGGGELLIDGNWISGLAVGDRIDAGKEAGDRLAQAVRRQRSNEAFISPK